MKFALEQFARHLGQPSISDVARRSGWSERRFSQIFREQVGFPPKTWCRLQRFRRAVRQLRSGVNISWADLAATCGFYDQAHFANEFRSFSGFDLTTYISMSQPLWASDSWTE